METHHRQAPAVQLWLLPVPVVEEWLGLFDDPILGNSALDRLQIASIQIVIEGSSYRGKTIAAPAKGGIDSSKVEVVQL